MDAVLLCLDGQPDDRKIEADPDTGITEKTVRELRKRNTWPTGLVLVVPKENSPWLTVEVVKAEL
jgi:hypothetical protein